MSLSYVSQFSRDIPWEDGTEQRNAGHEHPAILNSTRLAVAGARMDHKSVQDNTMWGDNKIKFLVSLNISLNVNFSCFDYL